MMARRRQAARADIGLIGGSGLYEIDGLHQIKRVTVSTPFGPPSSPLVIGELDGIHVAFLSRHGIGHRFNPSEINYRANIYALKAIGVRRIISVSAVGSMKEDIHPLDLVIPDQFYDQTRRRVSTFFGEGIVGHVGMADPVCPGLGDLLEAAGREAGARVHRGGTYICIEGPQFSTKGESQIFRRWGVSVIGMTNMPEAKLAREAELCYATLALATDYDVWHESHAAVTVEAVVANLLKNVATAKVVLRRMIPRVGKACAAGCGEALASAVITNPKLFPPRTRKNLALLLDRYFPPAPRGRRRG